MRPSSILTFEPGLEHGVPWGRDLFTFVTSAAGHMMRTLQKPRKNKPSKRQVNHRRFLHNMIQRKFAEIEAANHQLASALFSADKSPNHLTSRIVTEVADQSPKLSKRAIGTFINAEKIEAQQDVCDLWTLDSLMETHVADKSCKSFSSRSVRTEKDWKALKNNPIEKEIDLNYDGQPAYADLESFEDSVSSWLGSVERSRTYSKPCSKHSDKKFLPTGVEVPDMSPTSPVISLLSLDSCDLEVQMLIDAEHIAQTQDSTMTESLQMDMVDELDLLDCSDNHGDLQIQDNNNNPKCKLWMARYEEGLQETSMFPSSLDSGYGLKSLTGSGSETNNYISDLGLEFDGFCDQEAHGSSCDISHNEINYLMNANNMAEDHFDYVETCMRMNVKEDGYLDSSVMDGIVSSHHAFPEFENQLDSQSKRIPYNNWELNSEKDQYIMMQDTDVRNADKHIVHVENLNEDGSCGQCPIMCCFDRFCNQKGESCFYSKFRGNQSGHSFEGVARSFPATLHKIHPTPIPTPPLDDDWLFSNIVAEEEVNGNTFEKY